MLSASPAGAPARCLVGRGGHWCRGRGAEGEAREQKDGQRDADAGLRKLSERALGIAVGGPQGGGGGGVVCTTIANRKRRVDLIRLKWGKQNKTSERSRLAGNDREACGGRKAGVQSVQGLLEKSTVGSGRKSWNGALKRRSPGGRSTPKALERRANPDALKPQGLAFQEEKLWPT